MHETLLYLHMPVAFYHINKFVYRCIVSQHDVCIRNTIFSAYTLAII